MLSNRTAWILSSILLLFLGLVLLFPIVRVISGGFYVNGHLTVEYLWGVFQNPIYAEGLYNSLRIALGTVFLASLIAMPLAWLAHTYNFPGKTLFAALLLVPLVLPPFVGAIGIVQMLGPYGALNTLLGCGAIDWIGKSRYAGVVLLQALAFYPIIYLNVSASLANIDPAMNEAAQTLGASRWQCFQRITLPLLAPGLFAGGTLVFVASFTELGTPLIMNYSRCAAIQVYDELKEISSSPFPYALVTVVLCASVILYILARCMFRGRSYAMHSKAVVGYMPEKLGGWRALVVLLLFSAVVFAALLPHIGVIFTSFAVPGSWYRSVLPGMFTTANYSEALGHAMTLNSIRNSLIFSSLAVICNLVVGIAAAWVIVRSCIKVRFLIDTLVMLPLAVPGLVMAFGFIALSSTLVNLPLPESWQGVRNLLDVQTNPTLFLVIAYAVRRLPYMVRSAVAGLQQTSVTLEEAAANLGASPWVTLRRVTLPLIMANLIAGTLLTFAFSMLEVSDSLMLAQKMQWYPITKAIFELFQLVGIGRYLAAALGVWAMMFLTVTLAGSSILLGKKLGALFRI